MMRIFGRSLGSSFVVVIALGLGLPSAPVAADVIEEEEAVEITPAPEPARPAPAPAAEEEECPTWFPDLRCGRHGRYDGFVMPMQMPYLFEDPFITTGLSLFGIWHQFPPESALEGGHLWLLALQARLAITDRLAFIATKDGYTWQRPGNPALANEDGFYDITVGFKYALVDRPEDGFIVSPSFRFDVPVGQNRVFQGNGDSVMIPGVSAAWGIGDLRLIGDLGGRVPIRLDEETTQFFWNVHAAYNLLSWLVPFVEMGGLHYTDGGDGSFRVQAADSKIPLETLNGVYGPFDAVDVGNIGSLDMAGKNIVIFTAGLRIPIGRHLMLGASWDYPVTAVRDIWKQRATMNLNLEF